MERAVWEPRRAARYVKSFRWPPATTDSQNSITDRRRQASRYRYCAKITTVRTYYRLRASGATALGTGLRKPNRLKRWWLGGARRGTKVELRHYERWGNRPAACG